MSEDRDRQNRLTWIKQREKAGLSFVEIVNNYNATFGTKHFGELFGSKAELAGEQVKALPGKKRDAKEFVKDMHDVFLGEDGFLGF
jgi:hypothetical protein